MRSKRNVIGIVLSGVVLAAVSAGAFSGMGMGQQTASKADTSPMSGAASVSVAYPDGKPVAGASVFIGKKAYKADAEGKVQIPGGVPTSSSVASAEAFRGEGGFLGFFRDTVRYGAFARVFTEPGQPVQVSLKLQPVGDPDAQCRTCHPDSGNNKPSPNKVSVRCVHSSGVPVKAPSVARVRQFNQENEALKKAGKPAMPPIHLAEVSGKSGLFGKKPVVLQCLSCHTNHVETGIRKFVIMPFDSPSTLCRGCHV